MGNFSYSKHLSSHLEPVLCLRMRLPHFLAYTVIMKASALWKSLSSAEFHSLADGTPIWIQVRCSAEEVTDQLCELEWVETAKLVW
jgi:hypothetical protein